MENDELRYAILEDNMERLRKKMSKIKNKCRKYGCDFHFEEVGEEYRELKDAFDRKYTAKFIIVEAKGTAVVNGWRYIAALDYTGKGNIIRRICDIEIPERYYTQPPVCEHCQTNRTRRKYTYIVQNEETGEFKQVGKSCLMDFTHGLSAELAALYVSAFNDIICGEAVSDCARVSKYIPMCDWLRFAAETIRHFGYVKAGEPGEEGTASRAKAFYDITILGESALIGPKKQRRLMREMEECKFDADSKEAAEMVKGALAWLAEQEETGNYMHNLKTVCELPYIEEKHLAIAASLFPTYNRGLERQAKKAEQEKAAQTAVWVGEVGQRIEVIVAEMNCVTGWETQWSYTSIYKIVDTAGNIFTWKTTACIDCSEVKSIKGTIKGHNEFRGIKQTELTRCKCT